MLTLVFFVYFGPMKSTPSSYSTIWTFHFFPKLVNTFHGTLDTKSNSYLNNLAHAALYRFQFTLITARPTIYLLLTMWLFFYTFGDFFLSIIFNYNTLIDTIPSGFFTFIKTHTIFMSESSNVFLHDTLFSFILFHNETL
jgi:hypothetical protein